MKNKTKFLLKRSGLLATLFLFVFMSLVYAATNTTTIPIYGPYPFSNDTSYSFTGDLSASNISGKSSTRNAYAFWHDARFQDMVYGTRYPSDGSYLPTVAFDLIPLPTDNMGTNRGYHVLPATPPSINMIAGYAGGNKAFVNRIVSEGGTKQDYPTGLNVPDAFYTVQGKNPWINFAKVVALSGGGINYNNMIQQPDGANRGIMYPTYKTTFTTTPWPEIYQTVAREGTTAANKVTLKNGNLYIDAKTFAYYYNGFTAWVVKGQVTKNTVLNDLATGRKMLNDKSKSLAIANIYTNTQITHYNPSSGVPVSKFSSLLTTNGSNNKMTLVVMDPYERVQVKPFNIAIQPTTDLELKCSDTVVTPAGPQNPGTPATVQYKVINHSSLPVPNTYLLWRWEDQTTTQRVDIPNLQPGEERIIPIQIQYPTASKQLIANLNANHDAPPNETDWTNNKCQKMIYVKTVNTLNYFYKSISSATVYVGSNATVTGTYGREKLPSDKTGAKSPILRYWLVDSKGAKFPFLTKTATLNSDDQVSDYITIPTAGLKPDHYTIYGSINYPPASDQAETTYSDNEAIGSLVILGNAPPTPDCGYVSSSDSDKSYRVCVPDGNGGMICWDEWEYTNSYMNNLSTTWVNKNASLTDSDVPLDTTGTTTAEAGQGFTFDIRSNYYETYMNTTASWNRAIARFPKADGTYEDIALIPRPIDPWNVRWELPLSWVSKHGDKVVYDEYSRPGSTDPEASDFYYPGGRAHYIPLNWNYHDQPYYTFQVYVYEDGIEQGDNILANCLTGTINVQGNAMNDFYVRQVAPDNPFPSSIFTSGPTSVWSDKLGILDSLRNWYLYK